MGKKGSPKGSKGFGDAVWIWPRGHEDAERVRELVEVVADANETRRKAESELKPLLRAQKEWMFGERPGWGTYRHGPPVNNNAEAANEKADMIVKNVLKADGAEA